MSGEWFSGLTDDGRPIVIDGHQVKTVSVTRQADGMLSVEFGDSGSVIMASPELVQEWADNVNTLLAQRDAARDIAARLEGELAEVKVYLRGLRDRLRMDEVDAQGIGDFIAARAQVNMLTRVINDVDRLTAIPDDDTDPDAVIAEGES